VEATDGLMAFVNFDLGDPKPPARGLRAVKLALIRLAFVFVEAVAVAVALPLNPPTANLAGDNDMWLWLM